MTVDSVIAPELLDAEIAAIEDLLVHYEDWRALAQLEARERKGELPANVASSSLKTLLLDKLATNPLFLRRQTLLKELERVTQRTRAAAAADETSPSPEPEDDDLTRIRGIDARLERRLNALNITSYSQIAVWEEADVDYFARTLGLEDAIVDQKWIEQAAVLAARQKVAPKKSASSPITRPPEPQPAPPRSETVESKTREKPSARFDEETKSKAAGHSDDAAKLQEAPVEVVDTLPASAAVEIEAEPEPTANQDTDSEGEAQLSESTPAIEEEAETEDGLAASILEAEEQETPSAAQSVLAEPEIDEAPPQKPEPDYSSLVPAMPLAASAYATPFELPDVAASVTEALSEAPDAQPEPEMVVAAPEIDTANLKPATPLAAAFYAGSTHAPPHIGETADGLLPPKPKAASKYHSSRLPAAETALQGGPTGEASAEDELPDGEVDDESEQDDPAALEAEASGAVDSDAAGSSEAATPADKEIEAEKSAGDILDARLPPLPLKPLGKAPPLPASGPVETPAKAELRVAPPPLAPEGLARGSAERPTRETPSEIAAQPLPSVPPPMPQKKPASQPVPLSEAGLLAAAAARAPAAPPPPLPPSLPTAPAAPVAQSASQQDERKSIQIDDTQTTRQSNAEARVTIRRAEEAMANAILRVPGGTDVHLRNPRRASDEKFDGRSYAAYHSEVEEARVEIRRTPAPGAPRSVPSTSGGRLNLGGQGQGIPAPPGLANAAAQAAESARRAAAEAAAKAAAALTAKPPAPPPPAGPQEIAAPQAAEPDAADAKEPGKPVVTMGRFLKALTGQ
ncbi:MAG: hypothetical protein KDJ17_06560 [Hyphomicrobiaceae bacterium]|nr:hypothetical protein [Hyphomicrobiaceae bacterium]